MSIGNPSTPLQSFVPPLEPGDRLTRAEFERRYEAMPHLKKAELIEGIVYMPAAVRHGRHGRPHSYMIQWLGSYVENTPGVDCGSESSARLDMDNEPQPDGLLLILPECGGQCQISEDDYIENAPELVAEVSSSTVSFDLHTKKNVYRRCGVQEYIVWRVLDHQIDWFLLQDGEFVPQTPDQDGVYRSKKFPGLWLNVPAMIAGRLKRVRQTLEKGLATEEHAKFVAQLKYQFPDE